MPKKMTNSSKKSMKNKQSEVVSDVNVGDSDIDEAVVQDALNNVDACMIQLNEAQANVLELTKQCDQLTEEVQQFKDQSLRSLAELENVKRRKEQEKQDAIKFANERLILDLLPILDAFDLAMGQSAVSDSKDVQAVVVGFEMIQKQLSQFLDKLGVQKIEALGQPFNPEFHQGISQESHPDKDENTVVKDMQSGYMLNNRVIRPSMVVVSTK